MPTINMALNWARDFLYQSGIEPSMDAQWLLEHCTQRSGSYLFAHGEQLLDHQDWSIYQKTIARRCADEPLAYICGHTVFREQSLKINAHALVPRPETEQLVNLALKDIEPNSQDSIADLGTGSGAIAISLAHERPNIHVHATDKDPDALNLSKENVYAQKLESRISLHQGDWCAALVGLRNLAMIISNPPYISQHDPVLVAHRSLGYEPRAALVSGPKGTEALLSIIGGSAQYLQTDAPLWLEHAKNQATWVCATLRQYGWRQISSESDLDGRSLFTRALRPL